jgi:ABC-type ATPase with predicted acetyltransferase domain
MHRGEFEPMNPSADAPAVVVSLQCERCTDDCDPDPECPRCRGSGIELLRVRPQHAALPASELRSLYSEPRPPARYDPQASR